MRTLNYFILYFFPDYVLHNILVESFKIRRLKTKQLVKVELIEEFCKKKKQNEFKYFLEKKTYNDS